MPSVNYEDLLAVVKTMKLSEISAETLEKIKSNMKGQKVGNRF
jgi:hypothetical protein